MAKRKSNGLKKTFIHRRALVSKTARIGEATKVWAFAQVGDNAKVGRNCVIGNGAYIDRNVIVGNNVKIQNKALLYDGLIVEDDCFIGPGACFANDKYPRYDKRRNLKGVSWHVGKGASIGANATILPDVDIGKNAIVGAGSVVTRSVVGGLTVCGNPARSVIKKIRKKK